jgi:hypothetical protein
MIVMRRDDKRRFSLGCDLGLNNAISHRIAGNSGPFNIS